MTAINSIKSFYTAKSYVSDTTYPIDNVSPLIELNGKLYNLTVYHKKPNQSEWKEITSSCLKLARGIDFQGIIQQNETLFDDKIEIQASIYPNENNIYFNVQNEKVEISLTDSQKDMIFQVFNEIKIAKNTKQHKASIGPLGLSLSKKNLDETLNSSIKLSLAEVKEERIRDYLEQVALFNQPIKELEKPIYRPVGFKNKSMNCGFNSCLQMILNEPALVDVYRIVATYYKSQSKKEDKSCGEKMLSVLEAYDQAIKKQEPISEEVSNEFRLAVHYLSARKISSESFIQEDANEILMILFSKYEQILKNEEVIFFLQDYRNALKDQKSFEIPSHLNSIVANKNITQDLLNEMIEERRLTGEQNLLNTSLMHYEMEHIVHHKFEKNIPDPKKERSILNEDNTLTRKEMELDLKIKFNPKQEDLTLINLLQKHFSSYDPIKSERRQFIRNGGFVEVSIVKEELRLSKLPKHLLINLERFVPNVKNPGQSTKFTNPIEIPEELDAKLLKKDASNQKYELSSFIVHIGQTINGGHYIAYRKVKDQWVKCDDGDISDSSKEEMLTAAKNSYICFYKLKSDI